MIHPFDLKFKWDSPKQVQHHVVLHASSCKRSPVGLGMRVLNNANMMALN